MKKDLHLDAMLDTYSSLSGEDAKAFKNSLKTRIIENLICYQEPIAKVKDIRIAEIVLKMVPGLMIIVNPLEEVEIKSTNFSSKEACLVLENKVRDIIHAADLMKDALSK